MKNPSLWCCYPADGACAFHRSLQPARFCSPALSRVGIKVECGAGIPPGMDFVLLHGLPTEAGLFEIARQRQSGMKFIWSLDDDMISVPTWNPACMSPQGRATYDFACAMADHVIVSTPAIAKRFAGHPSVHVCPNLLDLSMFPVPAWEYLDREQTAPVELPVRVCWVGGITHSGDLDVIADVVDLVLPKLGPDRVEFRFMGMLPSPVIVKKWLHRGVAFHSAVPFEKYQKAVCEMRPNVYLAPLADCEFNCAKSNLRLLEGWALGCPVVASPVGEYRMIRSGVDGRLADTPDAWASAIIRLATDHQLRQDMAVAARARVVRDWDWNKPECRAPWITAFAKIMGIDAPADQ